MNAINIISDTQSRYEDEFKAEGNVIINFDGKQIKSDRFTYNKNSEVINLIGNILFKKGSQYFQATKIHYNLKEESGYLKIYMVKLTQKLLKMI